MAHGRDGVRDTVAGAREHTGGEKRLVAYVVADHGAGGAEVSAAELRAYLEERVPAHMIPAAFVVLDALPLTPNGKIDRSALPAPRWGGAERGYVAPATPTQRLLAELWEELLGVEQVGVDDNFFELGGHSLLQVRVLARLRERFGGGIALMDLFQHRTLGALAGYLERREVDDAPVEQSRQRAQTRRARVDVHRAGRAVRENPTRSDR
jgi:aryl carrier-like protein